MDMIDKLRAGAQALVVGKSNWGSDNSYKRGVSDMLRFALDAAPNDNGWVYNGPDGEWHWSQKPDLHESVTDQRPATALERVLLTGRPI